MIRNIIALNIFYLLVVSSASATTFYTDGGVHNIGGGLIDSVFVSSSTTVNLAFGTVIHGTDKIGSGSQNAKAAIDVFSNSILDVVGGSYTGGNAEVTGGTGTEATGGSGASINQAHGNIQGGIFKGGLGTSSVGDTRAGHGLSLLTATATILGGTFTGNDALSTAGSGFTVGGNGLSFQNSTVEIFGGIFSGGMATRTGGSGTIFQGSGINAFTGSTLTMFGGTVSDNIKLFNADLIVVGTNLLFDGSIVSGLYGDGSSFSHNIILAGSSQVTLQAAVPEPATAALFGIGLAGIAGAATRRRMKKAKK